MGVSNVMNSFSPQLPAPCLTRTAIRVVESQPDWSGNTAYRVAFIARHSSLALADQYLVWLQSQWLCIDVIWLATEPRAGPDTALALVVQVFSEAAHFA